MCCCLFHPSKTYIFPKVASPYYVKCYRLVNPYPMLRKIVVPPSCVTPQKTCSLILGVVNVHVHFMFD